MDNCPPVAIVPRQHSIYTLVRKTGTTSDSGMFLERFDSLVECAEHLAKQELTQITLLTAMPVDQRLRQLIAILRQGGLLTTRLNHALNVIVSRNFYSRSDSARGGVTAHAGRLEALRDSELRAGNRLDELGRRRGILVSQAARHVTQGPMNLEITPQGEELSARAALRLPAGHDAALILLKVQEEGTQSTRSVVALPVAGGDPSAVSRDAREAAIGRFSPIAMNTAGEQASVKACAYIPPGGEREALLCPEVSSDRLRLILRDTSRNNPPKDLTGLISIDHVKQVARRAIEQIAERCLSETLEIEDLQIVGTTLARELLTAEGQNYLATVMRSLRRVVVLDPNEEFLAPFEWLRPINRESDVLDLGMLCQHTTVVRFPANPIDYLVYGRERQTGQRTLCTVGLPPAAQFPWRNRIPEKRHDLPKQLKGFGVLHLVGHLQQPSLAVRISDTIRHTELSIEQVHAYPFASRDQDIVLSACEVAVLGKTNNLAQSIAADRGCAVWTPVVPITDAIAERIDQALAVQIGGESFRSTDDVFKQLRSEDPYAHVYIRYGV